MFSFLRDNARWLAAGFLLALGSSFGQTFFIALYSEPLRQEFGLSHGGFGALYMVATLASAVAIVQVGRLADTMEIRKLGVLVALCLGAVCLAMALVGHWLMLVFVIFGLRLFGQGMMGHVSNTAMARWFDATRGRALAVSTLGYPVGEAVAPIIAVALIGVVGWRGSWGASAAFLAFILVPVLWWLLADNRTPQGADDGSGGVSGLSGRHWTRGEVVRQPLFWLLLPGVMSTSAILTVFFFLPAHIAEAKGWAFSSLPQRYWIYAVTSVVASISFGFLIDRFTAVRCLPFYQVPMACGLLVLWQGEGLGSFSLALGLFGLTAGAAATLHSAMWAEIYGTKHIGAIKALAHAAMVFSTAAGPGISGWVIDRGVAFPDQALWITGYVGAVCALYFWIIVRGPLAVRSATVTAN